MAVFKVTAAAVVAKVEDARREVYFYRGAVLPPIVSEAEARRLVAIGLVAEIEVKAAPAPAEPVAEPVVEPVAEPVADPAPVEDEPKFEAMNLAQLREYAEAHNVALNGARSKAEIVAAIKTAQV